MPQVQWNPRSPGYRLLTEAEWEYIARAGKKTVFAGGDNAQSVGWFAENSNNQLITSASVGGRRRPRSRITGELQLLARKDANAWGFHDMSGNVWEWVWDYGAAYPHGGQIDPTGPERGVTRVYRGGSWRTPSAAATLSDRQAASPSESADDRGFRIVRYQTQ